MQRLCWNLEQNESGLEKECGARCVWEVFVFPEQAKELA